MTDSSATPLTDIDTYIHSFPESTRQALNAIREVIRREAPEASEKISYAMPTFYFHGNLIHFAAYEHHIGLYPAPSGIHSFQEKLKNYKSGKGSVRFPLDQEIPLELIAEITRFRVKENLEKRNNKKAR